MEEKKNIFESPMEASARKEEERLGLPRGYIHAVYHRDFRKLEEKDITEVTTSEDNELQYSDELSHGEKSTRTR